VKLLIDADSAIYKAGLSNEARSYRILCDDFVAAEFKYMKEVNSWLKEAREKDPDAVFEVEKHKEVGPLHHSLANLKSLCHVMTEIKHKDRALYISGEGNFRYDIYPQYKGHRDPNDKPKQEKELREYLIRYWDAEVVDGEEADDRVSYMQCMAQEPTCIVTIDKDLLNTPGWHYNYDKKTLFEITTEEADYNFALQLLTGDATDNIPGIKGVGAKTARKILPEERRNEWKDIVVGAYKDAYPEDWEETLIRNGRLLWMRREPEQMWDLTL